jgi:hypothetical protein
MTMTLGRKPTLASLVTRMADCWGRPHPGERLITREADADLPKMDAMIAGAGFTVDEASAQCCSGRSGSAPRCCLRHTGALH